ncbi:DUF3379 domain-containing protein [Shewanella sp. Choline-02u-19]|jgi:hypothetical protein|uniref:DUF3379 domain-containing protein n=1 Tax=unclassified Shewanella TaxID=196818 RepID=UPI000C31DC3D|nr:MULTISPECIES: DUF3379 domain-containing protein [unclassified Shewanella]PKG58927.1 DUF3379 domain-containing protein [Shewanella sp. GutDb-MelDb]PKG73440.1 DUF3379 domain-containing protein [Shewanella sp. GutCb]PKH60946.1 DUF3379 domain-containing protein [Shewanella sp. Bg11-22]PKI28039.1 DUF3379 domain-containing protein [Shewanella sp. Choline-02u-19]
MDELKFRRQAYGEPNNQDPEFLHAAMESAEREAFLNTLKGLDNKIEKALSIDVPDDLVAKLLLRQQLQHHHAQRRKTGFAFAMVASVAFLAGITFTLMRMGPVDLGQHALAHVYHEDKALHLDKNVQYQDVNFQLASLGNIGDMQFTEQPGKVFYSTYCDFQGVKSLHLVMQGEHGKVTLFIVPLEDRMVLEEAFADNKYKGMGFETDNAYMLLVGEEIQDLNYVRNEIKQTFI